MEKEQKNKDKLKAYLKTGLFFIVLSGLFMLFMKPFSKDTIEETLRGIIDSFTIPTVFFLGIGIISRVSAWGGYDLMGFAVSRFSLHNLIPGVGLKEDKKSYYEYKQEKEEKGRKWFRELFFTGLAGLGICLILLVVYFNI